MYRPHHPPLTIDWLAGTTESNLFSQSKQTPAQHGQTTNVAKDQVSRLCLECYFLLFTILLLGFICTTVRLTGSSLGWRWNLSFLDSCGTLQASFCVARACSILDVYLDDLCHLRTMRWLEPDVQVAANVQLRTNYSQFWLLYKLVRGEERAAFYLLCELGCVEFCIRILKYTCLWR